MKSSDQPHTGPIANLAIGTLVAYAMAAQLWDTTLAPTIDGVRAALLLARDLRVRRLA